VNDVVLVRISDSVENLNGQFHCLLWGESAFLPDQMGEVAALHEFKYQVRIAFMLAGLENRHDVGVLQFADCARFINQHFRARQVVFATGKVYRFDCHLALQVRVFGQVNHALGAFAENA
jgi:hypothetical protein